MSLYDLDHSRRMAAYLKPEDLNTDACLTLASAVLEEAAEALTQAVRRYNDWPSEENMAHLRTCQAFYRGNTYAALSCGVVDGETVIRQLTRDALRGRTIGGSK